MNRDELEGKIQTVKGRVKQTAALLRTTLICTTKVSRTKWPERPRRPWVASAAKSARLSGTSATPSRSSEVMR